MTRALHVRHQWWPSILFGNFEGHQDNMVTEISTWNVIMKEIYVQEYANSRLSEEEELYPQSADEREFEKAVAEANQAKQRSSNFYQSSEPLGSSSGKPQDRVWEGAHGIGNCLMKLLGLK